MLTVSEPGIFRRSSPPGSGRRRHWRAA